MRESLARTEARRSIFLFVMASVVVTAPFAIHQQQKHDLGILVTVSFHNPSLPWVAPAYQSSSNRVPDFWEPTFGQPPPHDPWGNEWRVDRDRRLSYSVGPDGKDQLTGGDDVVVSEWLRLHSLVVWMGWFRWFGVFVGALLCLSSVAQLRSTRAGPRDDVV